MAEHNVNTVKTQIQSLINLANETTGNNDTNLTDGVNALVSGYGQGGSGGTLEGLENGYDVMFYDENNEGLAFYSIKQGNSINAPIYQCKAWENANGEIIEFPYTPNSDLIVYAINKTYVDQLYTFFGVDQSVYPYLIIGNYSSNTYVYFGVLQSKSSGWRISGLYVQYTQSAVYSEDLDTFMTNILSTTRNPQDGATYITSLSNLYANFDVTQYGATSYTDLNQ